MLSRALLIAAGVAMLAAPAAARVNATGAIATFLITECAECTADKNSIFCTEAADDTNFVANRTTKITIRTKKALYGAADGAKFCWQGTFGKILDGQVTNGDLLGSTNITANLACAGQRSLFYRQCVLHSEIAIALIAIAAVLCVAGTTCTCFYCGCCKCCNTKGDESKWGMCNRFCPSAPCADPPDKESEVAHHILNPLSEEENRSSLFGKNPALLAMEAKAKSLQDLKRPGTPSGGSTPLPPPPPPPGSDV